MHDLVSRPRNGLSLCAGAGGLDMGLMLAEPGFHTRCFVEWEPYPRSALIAAQRAGYFAPAPIWDDVTTFDGKPFRGAFDTVLAGYPCQPFSMAGQRKGADDERHLWPDVARIIREVEPEWVFLENVAGHVTLGLEAVLRELWDMGFTPAAGLFSAGETGAPHERLRVFVVAHQSGGRCGIGGPAGVARCGGHAGAGAYLADASNPRPQGQQPGQRDPGERQDADGFAGPPVRTRIFPPGPSDAQGWATTLAIAPDLAPAAGLADCLAWAGNLATAVGGPDQAAAESDLRRLAHGLATRPRALRLLGNGVFTLAAAHAWRTLSAAHGLRALDLATAGDGDSNDTSGFVHMSERAASCHG